jgi:hypothetical protein
MLNRVPTIASAAVLALSLSAPALAQSASSAWGDANNGYGLYHQSNGAATGQDTNENGYGYYHESNGAATGWSSAETGNGLYHQSNSSATKKPVQSKQ